MTLSYILVVRHSPIFSFHCVFTSRPTSLLVLVEFCVFLYVIYVFTQVNNTVSTDQELMRYIQFQSFLIFLNLSDGIF